MGGTTDNSSSPSFSVSAATPYNRIVSVDTCETFDGRIFFFDAGETFNNGIVFVHACGSISRTSFLRVTYR